MKLFPVISKQINLNYQPVSTLLLLHKMACCCYRELDLETTIDTYKEFMYMYAEKGDMDNFMQVYLALQRSVKFLSNFSSIFLYVI